MKKLCVMILTFLTCGMLYALPITNPSDPSLLPDGVLWEGLCPDFCDPSITWCDAWSFRLGFYGDYVFNRHLQVNGANHDDIEDVEIFTNAAYLILNFYDSFDLFATFGASNLFIDTNVLTFLLADSPFEDQGRMQIESVSDFSWSIGARAVLFEYGCTALGAEVQYFQMRPDLRRLTFNFPNQTGSSSLYNDRLLDAKYKEWQFGLGISHRISNNVVPYLALKWSQAKVSFDNATFTVTSEDFGPEVLTYTLFNLKSQKFFGWAVGVTLINSDMMSITVEGRFVDEKAVHVNGQLRF